jgi:hypothetical protein
MIFYPGLHQPSDAKHFERGCVSINRLQTRRQPLKCPHVLIDSGAFTEISRHGKYRYAVADYAMQLHRLHSQGVVEIDAAVAQDYMCEQFILEKTGLTIADHQRLTIERYDELRGYNLPFHIMPVLQGYDPADYARHIHMYGKRLCFGLWVGVGSVCKRNAKPAQVYAVLAAIRNERPDLRLHGFGIKKTALADASVRSMLATADSMAWSFAARRQGRGRNDWREAKNFESRIMDAV